jgi:NADH-quinone oxidoreductase subunit L
MIMAEAFVSHGPGFRALGVIAVVTALLTAYYTFRVWFRVCAGPEHFEMGDEHHDAGGQHGHGHGEEAHAAPHAPRLAINLVLVVITVAALVSIFLEHWAGEMVAGSSAAPGMPHEHEGATAFFENPHSWMKLLASVTTLVGIAVAWYFHLANRKAADDLKAAMLANPASRWLPTAMENKWYVDEVYHALIRFPLWVLGHALYFIDRYLVDLVLVDGVGRFPRWLGRLFQPLQNGVLQSYAVSMAGGVGLVALLVLYMPELIQWLNRLLGGQG